MKKLSDDDLALFAAAVKHVKPLKTVARRIPAKAHRPASARRTVMAAPAETAYAFTDHLQETVGYDERLFFKTDSVRGTTLRALRQGKLRYSAILDLHGMTVAMARHALSHFLTECAQRSEPCVLVIHGKGRLQFDSAPKLKNQTNNWLKQHPAVLAFSSAQARDGGTGAVYVLLRRAREKVE